MRETLSRPLRVFLCHSSNDKPLVRELYHKLCAKDWIKPWLDEEELYPGQDWNLEIEKAVEAADAILVCLSNNSITKEGYVQRELRIVLDYAEYKPEGTLYIIPVRLEDCEPPRRLRAWQYADYFPKEEQEHSFQRLLVSLKRRADSLGLTFETSRPSTIEAPARQEAQDPKAGGVNQVPEKPAFTRASQASHPAYATLIQGRTSNTNSSNKFILYNGMEFIRIPGGRSSIGSENDNKLAYPNEKPRHGLILPHDYWMARFPVTNEQYNDFVKAEGKKHPVSSWRQKKDHPVAGVSWQDAIAYCRWLNELLRNEMPAGLALRLPTEVEWERAARGTRDMEYPWGYEFDKNKCNSYESERGGTTPVGSYSPDGDSPYGCADMAGNVWEWTLSLMKKYPYQADDGRENETARGQRVLRGGSFNTRARSVRCACRYNNIFSQRLDAPGFRILVAPAPVFS